MTPTAEIIHVHEVPAVPDAPPSLVAMSTDELRRELARQLDLTAQGMLRLAQIVRLLEDRGEDLSGLRIPLLDHLRRIAYGQVLPELVVRFAGSPMVLQRVTLLPLPDQRRLASGEPLELVVRRDAQDGPTIFDRRMADPAKLSRDQLWQVIGASGIRTEGEQQLYLEDRRTRPGLAPASQGRIRADRERGGLLVGRTFLPHAEIIAALATLREPEPAEPADGDPEDGVNLAIPLTKEEHRCMKIASARGDTTMRDLAWQALRAAGLI